VADGRLLLLQRSRDPWRGAWNLPAGYVEADEDPARAAGRCATAWGQPGALPALVLGDGCDLHTGHYPGCRRCSAGADGYSTYYYIFAQNSRGSINAAP
jgi:hypothetical protein